MSQMKAERLETYLAAGVIANAFRFVKFTAEYTIALCGAGDASDGVNQDTAAAAGRGIAIAPNGFGTTKIEAGAALAAGALVRSDASGRAITATTGSNANGRAIEAATALGDLIEIRHFNSVAP